MHRHSAIRTFIGMLMRKSEARIVVGCQRIVATIHIRRTSIGYRCYLIKISVKCHIIAVNRGTLTTTASVGTCLQLHNLTICIVIRINSSILSPNRLTTCPKLNHAALIIALHRVSVFCSFALSTVTRRLMFMLGYSAIIDASTFGMRVLRHAAGLGSIRACCCVDVRTV